MIKLPASKQQGFSLLEIVIAFSILALSLGILLKIFSGGVNTAMVSEDYTAAVQLAEGLMTRTGTESSLREGEESGKENDKYDWLVIVSPYFFDAGNNEPSSTDVALFKVKVIVSWQVNKLNNRQFDLTTIKMVKGS